jgi:membrane-bound ClpP family serine protease
MEMMGHPGILFAVLLVGGLALLIGELLLPTHGLLGVLGAGLVIAAIAVCFTINQWLGVAVMLAAVGIAPFAAGWAMKIWPKTPLGRKMVLPEVRAIPLPPAAHIGQRGTTRSDLRPTGEVDFDGQRVEAASELGWIPAGTPVKIVAIEEGLPRVRPADQQEPEQTETNHQGRVI